ncbi:MAG: LysM peptidoglycan-binding domain-containing protein [Dehalococcoidia bacterium]|nr:LysM peptidoglycan-binding domain-containing protein [Dehalococcoidia bacterium]
MRDRLLLCLALAGALAVSGCGIVGGDDDDDDGQQSTGSPQVQDLDIESIPEAPASDQRPEPIIVPANQAEVPVVPEGGGENGGANTYAVVAGDTCSDIATDAGITIDELIAANAGLDCGALQVDQQLTLPAAGSEEEEADPEGEAIPGPGEEDEEDGGGEGGYTIQEGDTASGIATACGITTDELAALNPDVSDIAALSIGQDINVPAGCSP